VSDPVIPPPEPMPASPDPDPGPGPETPGDSFDDQVRADLAAVSDLADAGVEVDGEVQVAESTWVLYGHTSYDGEVVVGVYHDEVEATAVLHEAPHHPPDENGPVP